MADHIHIIEATKNDTSFECDLCNRKMNKLAYYKSHFIRVHNKCLIVMPPVKKEKDAVERKTNSRAENKKKTVTKIAKRKKTATKIGKRKKTATQIGKRKKTTVKIEKTDIIVENTTETGNNQEMCLTTGAENENETSNVKKSDSQLHKKATATKIKNRKSTTVKVDKANIQAEYAIENVKEIDLTTQAENEISNAKKKIKKEIYECEVCNATFNSSLDLEKHSLSHEQESKNKCTDIIDDDNKSIVCTECGERFAHESAYTTHKLRHTLKCDRCDELFDSLELNFLKTHVCAGGEVYDVLSECEVCGKAFKTFNNLKVHRRIKHGLYNIVQNGTKARKNFKNS